MSSELTYPVALCERVETMPEPWVQSEQRPRCSCGASVWCSRETLAFMASDGARPACVSCVAALVASFGASDAD